VFAYWGWLAEYTYTPGSEHAPPLLRNVSVPFGPTGSGHLLVMAIHPKCPCSRASIGEMERLLSKFHDGLKCVFLVYKPQGQSNDWIETDVVDSIRRQPNSEVVVDVDGRDALQLGMTTSGAVILYSPQGVPKYWGGITAGRGHRGDNLGTDAIASELRGQPPLSLSQPVYGCQVQSDVGTGDG
jgi:hypothetical protein